VPRNDREHTPEPVPPLIRIAGRAKAGPA